MIIAQIIFRFSMFSSVIMSLRAGHPAGPVSYIPTPQPVAIMAFHVLD